VPIDIDGIGLYNFYQSCKQMEHNFNRFDDLLQRSSCSYREFAGFVGQNGKQDLNQDQNGPEQQNAKSIPTSCILLPERTWWVRNAQHGSHTHTLG
jgi:hypothetical protein